MRKLAVDAMRDCRTRCSAYRRALSHIHTPAGHTATYAAARRFSAAPTIPSETHVHGPAKHVVEPVDPPRKKIIWEDVATSTAGVSGGSALTRTCVYTHEGADADAAKVCFVAIHGAPGSTYDWRYLGPALVSHPGISVVRLELPGHGESDRPRLGSVSVETHAMAEATWRILAAIPELRTASGSSRRVVLLGHSLAADMALHMAAHRPEQVAGIALVNPVGLRPHQAIRPYNLMRALAQGLDVPLLAPILRGYLWYMYVYAFGFPKRVSVDEVEWCQRRVAARDFDAMARNCAVVRSRSINTFVAYAADDKLVETAVSRELSAELPPGPRFIYDHGGHYLPKLQAGPLSRELAQWAAGLPN